MSTVRFRIFAGVATALVLLASATAALLLVTVPWRAGPAAPTPTPEAAFGLQRQGFLAVGATGPAGETGTSLSPRIILAPGAPPSGAEAGETASGNVLEIAQRQVISIASLSLEVEAVAAAVAQARAIAESLGGFVEQLSRSVGKERELATATIRVPSDQFFPALERLEALGKVQSQSVGSEDVTERFIDLEARLKSLLRQEQSLLSLLERTQTVSEILTVERELSRVRSEIERLQGQLNFMKRRVDLATITVSLSTPSKEVGQPPFGALTVEVADVSRSVASIKALVSTVNGELDQVFISERDGKETATLSLRVFRADFERVVSSMESQGEVQQKEVREGTSPKDGAVMPEKPDASIGATFVERMGFWQRNTVRAIAYIGGPVVGAALLGFLFYLIYRAGRRRSRAA